MIDFSQPRFHHHKVDVLAVQVDNAKDAAISI